MGSSPAAGDQSARKAKMSTGPYPRTMTPTPLTPWGYTFITYFLVKIDV